MSVSGGKDQILQGVVEILVDRLALEEEELGLDSGLIDDLGADSLDFLDLVFSLEKKFGIKIKDGVISGLLRADFATEDISADGFIAEEEIDKLMEFIPRLRSVETPYEITPQELFSYLTVESLVILVEKKMGSS